MQKIFFSILILVLASAICMFFLENTNQVVPDEAIRHERPENEEATGSSMTINVDAVDLSEYMVDIENIAVKNATGRIRGMVISKTDSMHILAGGDWGGIWVSDDRGKSWLPVNDFATTLRTTSISQNQFQPNEYYYSTGVNKYDNGTLLLDVYRSVNGGYAFTQVTSTTNPAIGNIDKILCSPVDANTVYFFQVYGANNSIGALYRTTDKFATYQKVFQAPTDLINDFTVLTTGEVIVTAMGKIWKSATGNPGTYTLSSAGIPANLANISVAVCNNQPLIRYAAGSGTNGNSNIAVYKSIDGGINWSFMNNINSPSNAGRTFISVKPDDPNIVFAAGVNGCGSSNGGSTWKNIYAGWDYFGIQFDPNRLGIVFFNGDSGIRSLEITDFVASPVPIGKKYDSTLVIQDLESGDFSPSNNLTMAGMWDIGTHITRNNSSSAAVLGGDGMFSYCSKQDSNKAYCSFQGGYIVRLTNALNSTAHSSVMNDLDMDNNGYIDEGAAFINPYVMNDADDRQLYIPTLKRLWRSTNSGDVWEPVSKYYGNTFYRLTMAASKKLNPIVYWTNVDSIFVFGNAATAPANTDFGMPAPADAERIFVDPQNDSFVYLVKRELPAAIYHSSNMFNGNVQWSNIAANLPGGVTPMCITSYPGNGQVLIVGAYEGGIYISIDAGQTWTKEKYFPNVRVAEIKIRESDKKLFIFTHGRGIWTSKLQVPIIPLTLLSFTGTASEINNSALLRWRTAEELHTRSFEIEHSLDGLQFDRVTTVNAYGQGDHSYEKFVTMRRDIEYFRLKMIDIDNSSRYSGIVKVQLRRGVDDLMILNNPARNLLLLEIRNDQLPGSNAKLIDNAGRVLYSFVLKKGRQEISISQLPAGIHYLYYNTGVKQFMVGK